MKQNITITFHEYVDPYDSDDRKQRTIENFSMHQIGGEALQIVYGNKVVIYPMYSIAQVDIEQVEVDSNIVDVQVKE